MLDATQVSFPKKWHNSRAGDDKILKTEKGGQRVKFNSSVEDISDYVEEVRGLHLPNMPSSCSALCNVSNVHDTV